MFPWYWLADLCADHGIPCVLGHALSLKAIHGGKATNDTIDAHTIAVLRRGGMLPQAAVSPAERRATRDLLRRRMPLARTRGALLAHVHNTTSQSTLPAIGKKIASKANRDGVAERCAAPAVHKSMAVDLALIDSYDDAAARLSHSASSQRPRTMTPHTLSLLHTVPGIGTILSRVLLSTTSMIVRASRGCRIVPRTVASSRVPGHPRANARAPPAPQSATPLSRGPFPKPPWYACGIIPPRNNGWPDWSTNTAKAQP